MLVRAWQALFRSSSSLFPPGSAEDQADTQDADAQLEEKTADSEADARSTEKGKGDLFRPDPMYDTNYSAQKQVDVYGAKTAVEPPRPLLELGREQYTSGAYDESSTLLGEKNPLLPGLSIYGDWRTAVAYNQNGGKDVAQIATRLNIDVDLKITGTERIHAFFTPLQGQCFTRFEFGGGGGTTSSTRLTPTRACSSRVTSAPLFRFLRQEVVFDLPPCCSYLFYKP